MLSKRRLHSFDGLRQPFLENPASYQLLFFCYHTRSTIMGYGLMNKVMRVLLCAPSLGLQHQLHQLAAMPCYVALDFQQHIRE